MTVWAWVPGVVAVVAVVSAWLALPAQKGGTRKRLRWLLASVPWGRGRRLRRQRHERPPIESGPLTCEENEEFTLLMLTAGTRARLRRAARFEAAARKSRTEAQR